MSDQNKVAVGLDDDLLFEVAVVSAVDRAVTDYERKRAGRRSFADFIELAPTDVRESCEAALRNGEDTERK